MPLAALLLVSAPHSTSRATMSSSDRLSSSGVIAQIERSQHIALDFRRVLRMSNNYGLSADTSPVIEKVAVWTAGQCSAGECAAPSVMLLDRGVDSGAARLSDFEPGGLRAGSSDDTMTVADIVLMCLFAAGLIGYQLARKQRELRSSALFAATA